MVQLKVIVIDTDLIKLIRTIWDQSAIQERWNKLYCMERCKLVIVCTKTIVVKSWYVSPIVFIAYHIVYCNFVMANPNPWHFRLSETRKRLGVRLVIDNYKDLFTSLILILIINSKLNNLTWKDGVSSVTNDATCICLGALTS